MRYPFVYLASQSPRRLELLGQLGVTAELLLADPDEDAESLEALIDGEDPHAYVQRVTLAKAQAAHARRQRRGLPPAPILSADTTVTIDGLILGKPVDAQDAADILHRLSGRQHQVLTAVALVPADDSHPFALPATAPLQPSIGSKTITPQIIPPIALTISVSEVRFASLDAQQIARYIDSGEPFGKAGAYGIQGRAAEFIADLHGSYSGVMGLPLYETAALLRQAQLRF